MRPPVATPLAKRAATAASSVNGSSVYDVPDDDDSDATQVNPDSTAEESMDEPTQALLAATPSKKRGVRARFAGTDGGVDVDVDVDMNADAAVHTPTRKRPRTTTTDVFTTPKKHAMHTMHAKLATPATPATFATTPTRGRRRTAVVPETPTTRRTLADRSARKKSTRAFLDRMAGGDADDDNEDDEALNDAIFCAAADDADDADDDNDDNDDTDATEEEVVPPDDGDTLHADTDAAAKATAAAEDQVQVPEAPDPIPAEPVRRRRGRPPKASKAAAAATPRAADGGAAADAPVKRGPGRPRKTEAAGTTTPRTAKTAKPTTTKTVKTAKTTRMAREVTPPRDLPAHEHYFFHNRAGAGIQTSNNTLAALRLLTYDEYFRLRDGGGGGGGGDDAANTAEAADADVTTSATGGRHEPHIAYLEALHAQSFAQWAFELSQGFGVCLYGYGAKLRVLRAFAAALHRGLADRRVHKIVMANAAVGGGAGTATAAAAASTLRDILLAVAAAAAAIIAGAAGNAGAAARKEPPPKLPTGAAAAERAVLALLDGLPSTAPPATITLVLNGIDSPGLRRPAAQATLARLAAHHRLRLLCAADTPGFALLWDGAARSQLNLVFHDATTFRPLAGLDTVDDVHALLGRRVRRVGGKDGAAFVLRSLPENARNLFQLLVGEVLAADDDAAPGNRHGGFGYGDDDDDYDDADAAGRHANDSDSAESVSLEYRMLYNKAVEEFICSSEMAFRTLLKEFHDHQMVTSRKDAFGTEMLSLPFRRDELEALLEDLAA